MTPGRPRALAILTRDYLGAEPVGRVNIARRICERLVEHFDFHALVVGSLFQKPFPNLLALARNLGSGPVPPVQGAVFASADSMRQAEAEFRQRPALIYIDTLRLLPYAIAARRHAPEARIVIDSDDLLSRRYAMLARENLPLALGFVERMIPAPLARLAQTPAVSRSLFRYESWRFRALEAAGARIADEILLISAHERDEATHMAGLRSRITALPVPVQGPPNPPSAATYLSAPLRCVFIGTDGLVQNRMAIEAVLDLWRRIRPTVPLAIYGRMKRPWTAPEGVSFEGFAPDLATVYAPGSVLLNLATVPGGVKTKNLEALAYGTAVVSTAVGFESALPTGYPLVLELGPSLDRFVAELAEQRPILAQAAELGLAHVRLHHSLARFHAALDVALGIEGAGGTQNPA